MNQFHNDLLKEVLSKLGEHFEAVQILACNTEDNVSSSITRGIGCWYARKELAREFIDLAQARDNAQILKEAINPPEDGEEWKNPA